MKGKIEDKPGRGWTIEIEIDLGLDETGKEFVPMIEFPITPTLSISNESVVFATYAYETWHQFSNAKLDKIRDELFEKIKTVLNTETSTQENGE